MLKNIYLPILIILAYCNVLADGFIVVPAPNPLPKPFPLEVVYHKVNVEINGQSSVTRIDQEFYNPSNYRLEGYYIFLQEREFFNYLRKSFCHFLPYLK